MDRKAVNTYLLRMVQNQFSQPQAAQLAVKVNGFAVSVYVSEDRMDCNFVVKGSHTYSCAAGTTEGQDNYSRLSNVFEKTIPKAEEKMKQNIADLEQNLEQAKERVSVPFAHMEELENKQQELKELEERLSGLSVQEDDLLDPEDEADPVVETIEEKNERESQLKHVEDNDTFPFDETNTMSQPSARKS